MVQPISTTPAMKPISAIWLHLWTSQQNKFSKDVSSNSLKTEKNISKIIKNIKYNQIWTAQTSDIAEGYQIWTAQTSDIPEG